MAEPHHPNQPRDPEDEAFVALVLRALDDLASPEELAALNARLAADPDKRRLFVALSVQTAALAELLRPNCVAPATVSRAARWTSGPARRWLVAAAVLAAIGLGVGSWLIRRGGPDPVISSPTVAILKNAPGAVWVENPPSALPAGRLQLRAGLAEIEFAGGALVLLQGPAEFVVQTAAGGLLRQGKLTARVPDGATEFTIAAPGCTVRDPGTEFGMGVDAEEGQTELHVFEGAVAVARTDATGAARETEHVGEGLGVRVDTHRGTMTEIEAAPNEFARSPAPRPIRFVHWSFDRDEKPVSPTEVVGFGASFFDGKLPRATVKRSDPMRIPGKFGAGLYFDGHAAVDTSFRGVGWRSPRTVALWACIPTDARNSQNPLISWGTLAEPNALWRVQWNGRPAQGPAGRLRLSVGGGWVIGHTDLRDGRWHHLAVVYRGPRSENLGEDVQLYVDGQREPLTRMHHAPIATRIWHATAHPVLIGHVVVPNQPHRYFRGSLDEVFILDAALSSGQIERLMTTNEPPRFQELANSAPPR